MEIKMWSSRWLVRVLACHSTGPGSIPAGADINLRCVRTYFNLDQQYYKYVAPINTFYRRLSAFSSKFMGVFRHLPFDSYGNRNAYVKLNSKNILFLALFRFFHNFSSYSIFFFWKKFWKKNGKKNVKIT